MNKKSGLGSSLIRDKSNKEKRRKKGIVNPTEDSGPSLIENYGLKSVTENCQLQDFIDTAAQLQAEAERDDIRFVNLERQDKTDISSEEDYSFAIPRRPKWDNSMSKEEFQEKEIAYFMEWRRQISQLPNAGLYEKNLEVWRQLWHVIDKSDIIVQTVDARHPLLFHCNDLDTYIKEVDPEKTFVLLVNKVDFLTDNQKKIWSNYFKENGINAVFFSALHEMSRKKETVTVQNDEINSENESTVTVDCYTDKELNKEELMEYLKSLRPSLSNGLTVGFVGYPNVGKSSVINALLGSKQVCTSATPGKTKHFQTFVLDSTITICDCPGLVMQSSSCTKSELLLGGVLPVDEMQDHEGPLDLLASRLPKVIFEDVYGFILPPGKNDDQFLANSVPLLNSYGYMRGFMTQRGLPDNARSARYIIKDYLKGKLLFCQSPPGIPQLEYQPIPDVDIASRSKATSYCSKIKDPSLEAVESFFDQLTVGAHVRSNKGYSKNNDTQSSSNNSDGTKPWKKHYNRNKRTKLKKVYSSHDN